MEAGRGSDAFPGKAPHLSSLESFPTAATVVLQLQLHNQNQSGAVMVIRLVIFWPTFSVAALAALQTAFAGRSWSL